MSETIQKGKAWAVVRSFKDKEYAHKVETSPSRIDRTIMGLLRNMNTEAYFVDEWYEFPEKGQKDSEGKTT